MIRFDTSDKKPKLYDIAVISLVTLFLTLFLIFLKDVNEMVLVLNVLWAIYLFSVIVLLLSAFVRQLRYNPYSYNTIIYMGFSLFLIAFFVILVFSAIGMVIDPQRRTLYSLFGTLATSAHSYSLLIFPFIFLFSIGLCVSNIALLKREGKSFVNTLGILLSICLIGGEVFLFALNYYAYGSFEEVLRHDLIVNTLSAVYLYFECMMIGTIIANNIAIRYTPPYDRDFLIVLGCGIRKDGTPYPLLASRIDAALSFYHEQLQKTGKKARFIASGGQGPSEVISEARSIADYLLKHGISEEDVFLEDRSTTTDENMRFSKEIVDSADPNGKVAFATNEYHLFRSGIKARRVKMRAVGIGAKTKWYFWPNAAVREFIGLLSQHRLKQGLLIGGLIVFYLLTTYLSYVF